MDEVTRRELTIGGVARRARVNIDTLRYYERRGLVAKPPRTESNYRLYDEEAVRRVRFIKNAQGLGFSLEEITELLSLKAAPGSRCADVRERAERKIGEIDEKLRSLKVMRRNLSRLVAECKGERPVSECPILESLDEGRVR